MTEREAPTRVEEAAPRRVLIVGCGYVGSRLATLLLERGDRVWGLRRQIERLPPGVEGIAFDLAGPEAITLPLPARLDAVVYAVSAGARTEEAYRAAYVDGVRRVLEAARAEARRSPRFLRFVLVSSTGVYGEASGGWVDEDTPPEPADRFGALLLEGEQLALARSSEAITPVVLRLGGIYGPGRDRLVRRVAAGDDAPGPGPDRYTNRIHVEDAAGAIAHLLALEDPCACYLGVDREPSLERDVLAWVAAALQADRSNAGADAGAGDRAGAGAPRRGLAGKRCRSDRLVASGFALRYPSFREGYRPLIDAARSPRTEPRGPAG